MISTEGSSFEFYFMKAMRSSGNKEEKKTTGEVEFRIK